MFFSYFKEEKKIWDLLFTWFAWEWSKLTASNGVKTQRAWAKTEFFYILKNNFFIRFVDECLH